jgi:hypothetical protein
MMYDCTVQACTDSLISLSEDFREYFNSNVDGEGKEAEESVSEYSGSLACHVLPDH